MTHFPLDFATEELLQIEDVRSAFVIRFSSGIEVQLDWDRAQLPDVMLWISQCGRRQSPWSGRNQAIGIEPCNSCFDLTRVAQPPRVHPLSHRRGMDLKEGEPRQIGYRLSAQFVN